jgi:hypothetical protein
MTIEIKVAFADLVEVPTEKRTDEADAGVPDYPQELAPVVRIVPPKFELASD